MLSPVCEIEGVHLFVVATDEHEPTGLDRRCKRTLIELHGPIRFVRSRQGRGHSSNRYGPNRPDRACFR